MTRPLAILWLGLAFMGCAAVVAGASQAGPKIWDQTTAAWVQAIGSILAVGAVGAVAVWQAGESRKLINLERRSYRTTIAQFADEIAESVDDLASLLIEETEFMAYEGIGMTKFTRVAEALKDFDATRLVSARGALAMRDLIATVDTAQELDANVTQSWRSNGALDEDVEASVISWRDRFRSARQDLWAVARE